MHDDRIGLTERGINALIQSKPAPVQIRIGLGLETLFLNPGGVHNVDIRNPDLELIGLYHLNTTLPHGLYQRLGHSEFSGRDKAHANVLKSC